MSSEPNPFEPLLESVGIHFKNEALLKLSLTHSSHSNEKTNRAELQNNERLEFLGDAVIGLVIAERLMKKYPEASEGKLSRWRSTLVSRKTLAECAMELKLEEWMLLGKGEERSGGRKKVSILSGVFEAFIGAIYLDQGYLTASRFLKKIFESRLLLLEEKGHALWKSFDQKTHLQERTQSLFRAIPSYHLVDTWGREHEKNFKVEVELDGEVIAEGIGKSKKEAEQCAAERALQFLEEKRIEENL